MKCIRVNASRQYNVEIQHGALAIAGEETLKATHATGKALIVSDENVFPLYGETVAESLRAYLFLSTPSFRPRSPHIGASAEKTT